MWIHVELTTRCNAKCPACPRTVKTPEIQDLTLERLKEVVTQYKPTVVQLCGNLGDPVVAPNFDAFIDYLVKTVDKIQIHTNGSIRTPEWWLHLASKLKDVKHDVWFALDGLKGVHEMYRIGTDFNKVIENAQAFIDGGGTAVWQFIPFAHNEHQLKDCIRQSQAMGFKNFKLIKNARHRDSATAWSLDSKFNRMALDKDQVEPKNCLHLAEPSIFLSAAGKITPCCYMPNLDLADFKGTTYPECFRNCGSPK